MADNIKKLRLYEDFFNAEGMTDENSLSRALLTQPDVLSPVITHLVGREDKRFPLSFLTEGVGNTRKVKNIEYKYPVMGALDKVVAAVSGSGNGAGRSTFKIVFAEKWFVRQYIIESPRGIQARVMNDPIQVAGGWEYTLQLTAPEASATCPASEYAAGQQWAQLFAPVAESGSRGNESNWAAPSMVTNQMSVIRKSYRYEGNAPERTVNVGLNIGGRTTTLWGDFEEWQHQLKWREEVEYSLWYSRYNRDDNGIIHLKDENGKPIPMGAGVLEQIPNSNGYARLTANILKNTVRDTLYGASDAQKMNIVLFTGLGGLEEFDNAMKEDLASKTYIKLDSSNFVGGGGRNLSLGGFFTSYEHIDGHTITVRHLPLLDNGARAKVSPKHPVTGLPIESYRMIFLDMSTYDGEANVIQTCMEGREFLRWAVAGATIPKGFSGNDLRASDVDGSSVHFMKTSGIQIKRATNCFDLTCTLS